MCVVVRLSVGWLWHRWRCFSCRVLRPPCFFRSSERCVLCSSQDTYTQRRAACSFLLSDLLCKNARLTTNSSRFLTTHNCFRAVNLTTPSMYEEINGRLSLALQNISECSLKTSWRCQEIDTESPGPQERRADKIETSSNRYWWEITLFVFILWT